MSDPVPVAPSPVKPGYKTTEFYLKIAAFALTALYASGILPTSGTVPMLVAIAATMLGSLGYTVSRTLVKTAAGAALAMALLSTSSIGCTGTSRASTIKAALVTVDVSRDAFVAYDSAEQDRIVVKAVSLEQGKAALASYRNSRSKVIDAFTIAYRAIAMATTLNGDPNLDGLRTALSQISSAVAALTGGAK